MANRDSPCGFRPAQGVGAPHVYWLFPVDSSSSTATYLGDVMGLNAAGSVRPAAADIGVAAAGVCVAVYDSNKCTCGAAGSSVATNYLTGSVAGYALVALALPGAVFIGQGQTGYSPAAADIGQTTNHVAGTGSTTTGLSGHELNFNDLGTGLQFRIIGKVEIRGNDWASANTDIYVVFNESAFGCSAAAGV